LIRGTYQEHYLDGLGLRPQHFALATAVARAARVRTVARPDDLGRLGELADCVEQDFRTLGRP
jgi:hypothetical protein